MLFAACCIELLMAALASCRRSLEEMCSRSLEEVRDVADIDRFVHSPFFACAPLLDLCVLGDAPLPKNRPTDPSREDPVSSGAGIRACGNAPLSGHVSPLHHSHTMNH